MKIRNILIFGIILFTSIKSQTFDMINYFIPPYEWAVIVYNYNYDEFNRSAYSDSSIVLKSFIGRQDVFVENISWNVDTTFYHLDIHKYGTEIKRTFYDTLSVEQIDYKYNDVVMEINGESSKGGSNYLLGWIFPDSLVESIVDTLDPIPMYPYSKLYRFYNTENDDSLYISGDTLFLHNRSKYVNYNDSYFSTDYLVKTDSNLVKYSRYYSYYGQGFREKYELKDILIVDVENTKDNLFPEKVSLSQNYPNPFNPTTIISFEIPIQQSVKLEIFDVLGNKIKTLVDEIKNSGKYQIEFNGATLSSGVYYYQLQTPNKSITRKLLLLK